MQTHTHIHLWFIRQKIKLIVSPKRDRPNSQAQLLIKTEISTDV